jgi:pullulanase-type alpha-1,6-glucosidase
VRRSSLRGLTAGLATALLAALVSAPPAAAAPADAPAPDLTHARAQWIDRDTLAWHIDVPENATQQLRYAPHGGITVTDGRLTGEAHTLRLHPVPGGLTAAQSEKFPQLSDYAAFTVDRRDRDKVRSALRGQLVAAETSADGDLLAATGVQIPGVLDDLYGRHARDAELGPVVDDHRRPTLSVWAPTARRVALRLDGSTVRMHLNGASGVRSVHGRREWAGKPYRYAVTVWAPTVRRTVTNLVTDPYSTALTADSRRSLVVDLSDPALTPDGWRHLHKPKAVPLRDAQIQELHVRDFSAADDTNAHPGTYLAFTDADSDGMRHLRALARAGVTHVHLLPTFDFSSTPERRADQDAPACDLPSLPADSTRQQECVGSVRDRDAYNWGYDPLHYTVPEGSYATDPDGPRRTLEYRRMVQGLNDAGLRVVIDVVYNNTAASGQDPRSVLDKIVPGYYHRLLADGTVANSTCCANTAPEHTMMGKLVVDSVVTWARQYKVDGFRFDLMGHHPRANILAVRRALDRLTPAEDGVDGKNIIMYGEGWNFGEVANDARFVQATQQHMAGTGVATFSDRARDAVRGGGPFDADPRVQGFASGLYTDPNGSPANGTPAQQKQRLLHDEDLLKVGLTGNLAGYTFTDSAGRRVTGAEVDYNGAPAGYARDPGDALAYVDAHDNETLYDALAYKLPAGTSADDRARMQVLAEATAVLSQGPSLGQAGSDLLRSKSLDRNSFDSGDWYNAVHWDCHDGNGFGRGLPPAWDNADKWQYAKPLLTLPQLSPGCAQIRHASAAYRDLLTISRTEDAFAMTTGAQVQRELSFPLSGTDAQIPGVVLMKAGDLVVVFNATPERQRPVMPSPAAGGYHLHPVQAGGSDEVVKSARYRADSGTFEVPGRTVAVFTTGS